jgi:hypothetical protein
MNRAAICSAAFVVSPTEAVVLISMSSRKISRARRRYGDVLCAVLSGTDKREQTTMIVTSRFTAITIPLSLICG